MFGNKPTFGASTSNTFGFGSNTQTNANPFGQNQQSMFGKPATGFGAATTSTFGQPQNNSLFSGQQQPSLFQNANTSFGAAPTTQSGFGSTGLFGQQQSSGGLFNSSGGGFGQQQKPAGFGFGQNQTQPGLFGQQNQNTGGSNLFQPQSNNLFGSGTSGFGGQQQMGTTIKFNPVTGTDTMMKNGNAQSINTKHHSITCMKEYEGKSFEELRWEDYQANRKGPQQGTSYGTTPFGATPSSTPSLFGQPDQNKSTFGQTSSVFGQPTSTFGQPSTAFGMGAQQNQMGSSLFGKPTSFGTPASSTTTTGFGGFGATAQNANPFGGTQQNKPFGTASVFGTTTSQPSTGFGTGTSLFGNTANQTQNTGMFGKPAQPTTGFGTLGQTTGFGLSSQPAAAPTSNSLFTANKPLFGATNTSTTGFGVTNNTFGQPQQNTFSNLGKSSFGTGLNTGFSGSTFGAPQQTTGLFGNIAKTEGGGLFGNTGTTGLFNNSTSGFNIGQPAQTDSLFPQNHNTSGNLALLTSDAFGEAPHLAGLEPKPRANPNAPVVTTNPAELKSLLDSSKKVDMSHGTRLKVIPKMRKDSLFEGIRSPVSDNAANQDYIKTSVRRLVIKPKDHDETTPQQSREDLFSILLSPETNKSALQTSIETPKERGDLLPRGGEKKPSLRLNFDCTGVDDTPNKSNASLGSNRSLSINTSVRRDETEADIHEQSDLMSRGDHAHVSSPSDKQRHPTGIICTRPEYYTLPTLDELAQYVDENGSCMVKGFTVGRRGYGNVHYSDEMDVAGLDLDQFVQFRYREINVYPDESKKPPVGQGLNRRAQVTLDNVYPKRVGTDEMIKDVAELIQMNFSEKLRKVTVKKNAKFVDYRPESGSWVFKVEHFSKYGFNDSDDEEDSSENAKKPSQVLIKKPAKDPLVKSKELALFERKKAGDDVPFQQQEVTKYGLDEDIFDVEVGDDAEDDVLRQSMLVDMDDDNYHHIPTEIPDFHRYSTSQSYKNARNVQVMKSTLFADDDQSSDASSHVSIMRQYLDLPEEMPPRVLLDEIVEEEAVVPVKTKVVRRPKVYEVKNFAGLEIEAKIPNKSYMDVAVFKGKSFKVGWNKGFGFYKVADGLKLDFAELDFQEFPRRRLLNECLVDSLKVVLQESSYELSREQIPTFKILKSNTYLLKQTEIFERLAQNHNQSPESCYLSSIWTLCVALWGPGENSPHHRRHLLTEWLKNNTKTFEEYDKSVALLNVDEKARAVFNLLSVFNIQRAADLCMENRFPQLSLLVSQLSFGDKSKVLLQEQVHTWYESLAANHITDEMKRIYLLLAGIPSKNEVNIFKDVDWKRAFAMHLWYIVQNGAQIESAIEMYRRAFDEVGYAEKPSPPYIKHYTEDRTFDVLYHILLLYKSNIHRLSSCLNPATHTNDPLDYRLSWLLMQLFLSLDVGLIEAGEKVKFCTSFSNQLESMGKWEWAIFVLLYIEDNKTKKMLITKILDRNLSPETDKISLDVQNNLVNNMKIPPEWIHVIKGEKTLYLGRYFEAFNHFAKAKNYIQANDIFVEHILPGLFINEQYDAIKLLVTQIRPGSSEILRWKHESGLVNDFLDLQNDSITIRPDELFKLQAKLHSITERLCFFPLKTEQQKLCVAEMSKRCASIYKELWKHKGGLTSSPYINFIEGLVMPPDFKQNEVFHLINAE